MKHLKKFNESMSIETRQFNREQASSLLQGEGVYDDVNNKELYVVVEDKITDTDQEKNIVRHSIVIEELETGKFFRGELSDSPWWRQAEANAEVVWNQVIPYTVTITKYRSPNKSDLLDMKIDKVIDK